MSEHPKDTILETSALPNYTAGFLVLSVEPVDRDGQYGVYHWGYRVRMKSASNSGKTYAIELGRKDTVLGSILWVWEEAPNKGIVFTRGQRDTVIASAKVFKDAARQ